MLLCERCIEAIRSRGERVVVQDVYYQEYQDEYEDPIKCEWCNEVEKVYGKKPLIYCSSWYTKKLRPLLDNNNGLWVAHYTSAKKPTVYTYHVWAMWQYSSDPYDKDIFNGTKKQFRAYCSRRK